jgi:hypothetical protein
VLIFMETLASFDVLMGVEAPPVPPGSA